MALEISGNDLTISDVVSVARHSGKVELSADAGRVIESSCRGLLKLAADKEKIYGLTVGCGELDTSTISDSEKSQHQRNLIVAHAAGTGPSMRPEQVRAMMLCRLNNLACGMSGVSLDTVNRLLLLLNENMTPIVPLMGSVGASDLIPLAHMACTLIGEGEVLFNGQQVRAVEAIKKAGLSPLILAGRDGLALINGLSQTTGIASLALHDVRRVVNLSICTYALTSKLLYPLEHGRQGGSAVHKNHATLSSLLDAIFLLSLDGHELSVEDEARSNIVNEVEERSPLSLRYSPHVFATTIDGLVAAEIVCTEELNAAVDNPLVDGDGWHTNNSGNTSGHRIGVSLEQLTLSLNVLAVNVERRIAQLLQKNPAGGLPPYLIHPKSKPGVSYGLMFSQYMAASLIAELRSRSTSRSMQSIPTGGVFEDSVSLCNYSAIHLDWVAQTLETLTVIELLAATQGFDCAAKEFPDDLKELVTSVRKIVPTFTDDRPVGAEIESVLIALREEKFSIPDVLSGLGQSAALP